VFLILVAAQDIGDLDRAREYAGHARAAIDRLGRDHRVEGDYHYHLGTLHWLDSKLEESLASFEQAARTLRLAGDDLGAISALDGSGLPLEELGRFDEAIAAYTEAMEQRRRRLGEDHPDLATSYNNLVSALMRVGRLEEALSHAEQALAIREQALGPEAADTAASRNNLGQVLALLGRHDEALGHYERALATLERIHGPEHRMVATVIEGQGGVFIELGRTGEAVDAMQRALAIFEETVGDGIEVGRSQLNLGMALLDGGRLDEALVHFRASFERFEALLGAGNFYGGYALLGIGQSLLWTGDARGALAPLRQALAIFEAAEVDRTDVARARFGIAQALWLSSPAEREQAVSLARQASEVFAADPGGERFHAEADDWLRARQRRAARRGRPDRP
jgi:eukaryotic-like serine/threonine-protein kinase